jgi:hypothetical protein
LDCLVSLIDKIDHWANDNRVSFAQNEAPAPALQAAKYAANVAAPSLGQMTIYSHQHVFFIILHGQRD